MTTKEFMSKLSNYSGGSYTTEQLAAVKEWSETIEPADREKVYNAVVQSWDTRYKTPPAVKHLKDYYHEVNPFAQEYEWKDGMWLYKGTV